MSSGLAGDPTALAISRPLPQGHICSRVCCRGREGGGTWGAPSMGLSPPSPSTYPLSSDARQDDDGSGQRREEDGGDDGRGGVEGEASIGASVEGEGAIPQRHPAAWGVGNWHLGPPLRASPPRIWECIQATPMGPPPPPQATSQRKAGSELQEFQLQCLSVSPELAARCTHMAGPPACSSCLFSTPGLLSGLPPCLGLSSNQKIQLLLVCRRHSIYRGCSSPSPRWRQPQGSRINPEATEKLPRVTTSNPASSELAGGSTMPQQAENLENKHAVMVLAKAFGQDTAGHPWAVGTI